jgi:hypothetical protein
MGYRLFLTLRTPTSIRFSLSPPVLVLTFSDTGGVKVTPGYYTPTGPRCVILIMDGIRAGRCLDGESMDNQPGGPVHVHPCTKRWNQFLSFGNGRDVPAGTIHTTVPLHTRNRIAETGREQEKYMCFGVARRGELDEDDWFGERKEFMESYEDIDDDEEWPLATNPPDCESEGDGPPMAEEGDAEVAGEDEESRKLLQEAEDEEGLDVEGLEDEFPTLLHWMGKQLMATRCSNRGAVIEWVLVPFIVEEATGDGKGAVDSTNSTREQNEVNASSHELQFANEDEASSTRVENDPDATSPDLPFIIEEVTKDGQDACDSADCDNDTDATSRDVQLINKDETRDGKDALDSTSSTRIDNDAGATLPDDENETNESSEDEEL